MGKDIFNLPVLMIGYSRTNEIRENILKLRSFGADKIFLSLDYADNPQIRANQEELIEFLRTRIPNPEELAIWHKKRNHGIAASVVSGIDWFFANCDRGIVLEDDLEFGSDFLQFCNIGLKKFESNKEILMLSGNRFVDDKRNPKAGVCGYPQIWGWATWRVKWQTMKKLILEDYVFQVSDLVHPNKAFFYAGAKRAQLGFVDTWDLPLAYGMLRSNYYSVIPPRNLVSNIGADAHASHTKEMSFPMGYPVSKFHKEEIPSLPQLMESARENNYFLEKMVFRVKRRHVLSPLKMFFEMWFRPKLRKYDKLKDRIIKAERYEFKI